MKAVIIMDTWKVATFAQPVEEERWVLLKIPRGDIDGVGEVK